MELWIRSQDKEKLIKVNHIYICVDEDYVNNRNDFDIYVTDIANNDIRIGTYTTKERTLEVLDEIQGRITSNECLKIMFPKVTDIRGYEEKFGELFKEMIYEMPEK